MNGFTINESSGDMIQSGRMFAVIGRVVTGDGVRGTGYGKIQHTTL